VIDPDDRVGRDVNSTATEPALADDECDGTAVCVVLNVDQDANRAIRGIDEVLDEFIARVGWRMRRLRDVHALTVAAWCADVDPSEHSYG